MVVKWGMKGCDCGASIQSLELIRTTLIKVGLYKIEYLIEVAKMWLREI